MDDKKHPDTHFKYLFASCGQHLIYLIYAWGSWGGHCLLNSGEDINGSESISIQWSMILLFDAFILKFPCVCDTIAAHVQLLI